MEIKEMFKFVVSDEYSGLHLGSILTSCAETGNLTILFPGLFG